MASTIRRSLRRWGASASTAPSAIATSLASPRSLSASARRSNDHKPAHSNDDASARSLHSTDSNAMESTSSGYQPPSRAQSWPFDSTSSSSEPSSSASASSSESTNSHNPYKGLFDGSDPFPKAAVPDLLSDAPSSSSSSSPSWLSDQLDALITSPSTPTRGVRTPNPNAAGAKARATSNDDGRRRPTVPRSVLFADSDTARQSEDFRRRTPTHSSSSSAVAAATKSRKRFDRTPLTQQEANAFMSLLNQALAGTSATRASSASSSCAGAVAEADEEKPFGSYTSLISNPRTRTGSKNLLQAFAKRNQLARFEAARAHRAKRFVREGLAAAVDPVELEAGVDEAKEQMAMCDNLADLVEWAKRQVWGISCSKEQEAKPKYGRETAFYPSVVLMVFMAIRDRYRSPHVALSVARVTRLLGVESYVVGVTGSLYNEVLKTQWDWLGDLQGVVTTLRQARETGILSAPQTATWSSGIQASFANSEDEAIRETVDRIANEVRKYVLDQQMASDPAFKRNFLYGHPTTHHRLSTDWSHRWLLATAQEAVDLAGKPFGLMHKTRRADHARGGAGDKPFNRTNPSAPRR